MPVAAYRLLASTTIHTEWGATRVGGLARLSTLPQCTTGDGSLAQLLAVEASEGEVPAADIVDVVIDMQPVEGLAQPLPIHVLCTADLMFATEQGPVRADALAGKVIHRMLADGTLDTFTVADVTPYVGEPARAYGIALDVGEGVPSVCIGSDATVAAIVFPTL